MRNTLDRAWRYLALLLVMAMIAAACGGDGDSDDDNGDDDAAAASTTEAAPDTTEAVNETVEPDPTTTVANVEEATGLQAVCEAGQEEGRFVYWATIEPDNFARLIEPFEARYPGIEIDFLSIREEDGAANILTALSAGQEITEPDLFYGSQDGLFPVIDRGLIDTEFDWTTVDVGEDMIHPSNMIRLFVVGLGIAYNTNLATPEDLPATWEDMISEEYEGQLVVDPRGNPYDLLSIAWGQEATLDYAQRLKETVDPIVIRGGTAGMTEVIAGGAIMTSSGRADSNAELQADGAPIEMHYMTDLVPVRILYNGLLDGAPNQNAAACFAGWLATDEGKAQFEAVEFKANEFPPRGVPTDVPLVFVDSADDAATASAANALLPDIIAPDFEEEG
jgi:iron(III) transport system substrate-binding protein